MLEHARDFVAKRLGPAHPAKDGKQTPWRGHPIFIAQHATATCCRGCLKKWHAIERGQPLSAVQQAHIVSVLERWLRTRTESVD
ncbi:MAG: putative protein family YneG [Betaproteobacteria bacterium]|jgi:hypothetical protein|nr:putative protein family YneG [Betaproteobacteria bacterium]MEA3154639.1 hypothetical protein [Betaproteobacteria bacterium]